MRDEEKLDNLIRDLGMVTRKMEKIKAKKFDNMGYPACHLSEDGIKVEVMGLRPVPVLKDRDGKYTQDYTLKEWLMKLHEELIEFEAEVQAFSTLDAKPGSMKELYVENKAIIAGEACDIITVLCGLCQQFGIDDNFMDSAMHNTYIKNRNRGYLND